MTFVSPNTSEQLAEAVQVVRKMRDDGTTRAEQARALVELLDVSEATAYRRLRSAAFQSVRPETPNARKPKEKRQGGSIAAPEGRKRYPAHVDPAFISDDMRTAKERLTGLSAEELERRDREAFREEDAERLRRGYKFAEYDLEHGARSGGMSVREAAIRVYVERGSFTIADLLTLGTVRERS